MQVIRRPKSLNKDKASESEKSGASPVSDEAKSIETKFVTNLYLGDEISVDGPTKVVFLGITGKNQVQLLFKAPRSTKIKKGGGSDGTRK